MKSNKTVKAFQQKNVRKIEQIKNKDLVNLAVRLFIKQGFTLDRNTPNQSPGNFYLEKLNERYIVTCLAGQDKQPDSDLIDSLLTTIADEELSGAFLVTTADFSDEIKHLVRGKPIMLRGRLDLQEAVANHLPGRTRTLGYILTLSVVMIILFILIIAVPSFREQHIFTSIKEQDFRKPDTSGMLENKETAGIYTYSYLDDDGTYRTISSSELLEFTIVKNKGVYSGTTEEGRRLAQFLNEKQ